MTPGSVEAVILDRGGPVGARGARAGGCLAAGGTFHDVHARLYTGEMPFQAFPAGAEALAVDPRRGIPGALLRWTK
jgi:hypothetical protein